ncbi:MAG TPA: hypothetical protein VFG10_07730 [Saprospiraceae bacterium]|nr:hypothetical protein [Saprospiraceae bacterium]
MTRHIFLLFFALCSYTLMKGQLQEGILGHKYYKKEKKGWNLVGREDYQYDKLSKLTESTASDREDGEWKIKDKTMYVFPGDSLRLEINAQDMSRARYVLDGKGNETGVTFEDFDSLTGTRIVNVSGLYITDADNHVVEKKYLRYKNGQWHPEDRNLFGYDSDGKVAWDIFQMWENNDWVTHQKSVYHDSPGNRASSIEIFYADKSALIPGTLKTQPDTRILITYDKAGRGIEKLILKNANSKWEDDFKRVSQFKKG